MSLFRYKVVLAENTEKISKITAKTKEAAQKRVNEMNKVKQWVSIKEEKTPLQTAPAIKATPPSKPTPPAPIAKVVPPAKASPEVTKPVTAKATTKLEKLLFLQSNKCFFCGRVLTKAEASVEHLQPKSGGGNNADGNVVACCVTLNRTFGHISLKEKVRIILDKAGHFTCPK